MAQKADNFTLIEDKKQVSAALSEIECHNRTALDCEGVNLGRSGTLTILIISTSFKEYIFDILKLGKDIFDEGLREFLEDECKEKLMFDCRQDSDILWHHYQVKLAGVLDIQLLEIMHRREHTPSAGSSTFRSKRRSARTEDVENVHGYLRCIELYSGDEDLIGKKEKGRSALRCDSAIWKRRPLPEVLIDYCRVDVSGMFILFEKLKGGDDEELSRLRVASKRYAGIFRDMPERLFDEYENHAFLPLDVIPEKGTLSFPLARTKCIECERLFPTEEFSRIQLRKGVQRCRVCKKVKLRIDVQMNREDNWERQNSDDDGCYYSDGDDNEYYLI